MLKNIQTIGSGAEPYLVLPGAYGKAEDMQPLAEEIVRRCPHVNLLLADLPSPVDVESSTFSGMAAALLRNIGALEYSQPFPIIAFSYGGSLVLKMRLLDRLGAVIGAGILLDREPSPAPESAISFALAIGSTAVRRRLLTADEAEAWEQPLNTGLRADLWEAIKAPHSTHFILGSYSPFRTPDFERKVGDLAEGTDATFDFVESRHHVHSYALAAVVDSAVSKIENWRVAHG